MHVPKPHFVEGWSLRMRGISAEGENVLHVLDVGEREGSGMPTRGGEGNTNH